MDFSVKSYYFKISIIMSDENIKSIFKLTNISFKTFIDNYKIYLSF
jgi:hypothetical protein